MSFRTAIAALLLAQACDDGPRLLAPEEVSFAWDEAWNEHDDGLLALVPLDVMVYDGATGGPLAGAELTLRVSSHGQGGLLPVEAVEAGEDGCEDCAWDAWSDLPVRLLGSRLWADETDVDGLSAVSRWEEIADVRLTGTPGVDRLALRADARGLVRVYVVVDSVDEDGVVIVEARHPGGEGSIVTQTRFAQR